MQFDQQILKKSNQLINNFIKQLYGIIDLNMNRYTHMKKTYFTKSQTVFPSPHPRQEFIEIIEMKKQYQSLIKQQLDSLESIENIQSGLNQKQQSNNQWLYGKRSPLNQDIKIIPFAADQSQKNEKCAEKDRQQKPDGEFIKSYEQLRIIKMQKHFFRLKNQFQIERSIGLKTRASRYLYRQTIQGKYFNQWKASTSMAVKKLNILKNNESVLKQYLKQQNSLYFLKLLEYRCYQKTINSYINHANKKKFLNRFCQFTSSKFTVVNWRNELFKLKKRQCFKKVKFLLQQKKNKEELNSKQKLLLNIYCHRRFNSFFTKCKQLKFSNERIKITQNIINQIDILKLIQKTSNQQVNELSQYQNQNQNLEQPFTNQSYSINIQLLSLILQNFVEEYSQEYNTVLGQQDHLDFLHQLKSECIRRLINKRKQQQVFTILKFHGNLAKLKDFVVATNKYQAIKRLTLFSKINASKRQLNQTISTNNISTFLRICNRNLSFAKSKKLIQQRNRIKKILKKKAMQHLRDNLQHFKIYSFKKDVSDNWRNHYRLKNAFIAWQQYHTIQSQSNTSSHSNRRSSGVKSESNLPSQQYEPQFQKQTQNINEINSIITEQPEKLPQRHTESEGIIKAKQQLSKIVNEISKGMGPKLPFDCYAKSIDNSSQKKIIAKRMKTQASNKQSQVKLSEQMCSQIEDDTQSRVFRVNRFLLKTYFKQFIEETNLQKCSGELIRYKKMRNIQKFINYFSQRKYPQQQYKTKQKLVLIFVKKTISKQFLKMISQNRQQNKCSFLITGNRKLTLEKKIMNALKLRQNKSLKAKIYNLSQCIRAILTKKLLNKLKILRLENKEHVQSFKRISILTMKSSIRQFIKITNLEQKIKRMKYYQKCRYSKLLIQNLVNNLNKKINKVQLQKLNENQKQQSLNQQLNKNQAPRLIITKFDNSEQQTQLHKKFNLGQYLSSDMIGQDSQQQSPFNQQKSTSQIKYKQQKQSQLNSNNFQIINSNHYLNSYLNSPYSHASSPIKFHSLNNSSNLQSQSPEISFSPNMHQQQNQQLSEEYSADWLTYNLKFNEVKNKVKKYRVKTFFKLFKIAQNNRKGSITITKQFKEQYDFKENVFEEDNQNKQDEMKQHTLISMIKKNYLRKLISILTSIEQSRIKKQEYERIVSYSQVRLQKNCKRRAFKALYSQIENKINVNAKQKCFTGWKLFCGQKKLLKEYLAMEVQMENRSVSYYPMTYQQKTAFQQLKSL